MDKSYEGPATANPGTDRHRVRGRTVLFAAAFLLWLLLAWPAAPADGGLLWGDIAAGVAVAIFVALVSPALVTHRFGRLLEPARYFWAFVFLFVFAYYVVIANLDVAYRVLHPSMPIRPGIVRARSRLQTASARAALANCITLTPGTLTLDVAPDGTFYIHWINVRASDEEQAARELIGRFEWFIQKIFE